MYIAALLCKQMRWRWPSSEMMAIKFFYKSSCVGLTNLLTSAIALALQVQSEALQEDLMPLQSKGKAIIFDLHRSDGFALALQGH